MMKGVLFVSFALFAIALAQQGQKFTCPPQKLEQSDRDTILSLINGIRNATAAGRANLPKASNMKEVKWDMALEEGAGNWSANCTFKNSPHARKDEDGKHVRVKEIIINFKGCSKYGDANWKRAFDAWINEFSSIDSKVILKYSNSNSSVARSWTLINWATTSHIGCGFSNWQTTDGGSPSHGQLIVCHLSEGGNIPELPVYTSGDPTTKCADGYKTGTKYNQLCSSDTNLPPAETGPKKPDDTTVKQECTGVDMNQTDKDALLKYLNTERSKIAQGAYASKGFPAAKNMKQLVWNADLATSASKAAAKCQATSQKEQNISKFSEVLFAHSTNTTDFTIPEYQAAADYWYEEREHVPAGWIDSFGVEKRANASWTPEVYTQIIWATTSEVGCSYANMKQEFTSKYDPTKVKQTLYMQYVICHFREAGNIKQKVIYEKGDSCTNCGKDIGCSTQFKGLCAPPSK